MPLDKRAWREIYHNAELSAWVGFALLVFMLIAAYNHDAFAIVFALFAGACLGSAFGIDECLVEEYEKVTGDEW